MTDKEKAEMFERVRALKLRAEKYLPSFFSKNHKEGYLKLFFDKYSQFGGHDTNSKHYERLKKCMSIMNFSNREAVEHDYLGKLETLLEEQINKSK